MKFTQVPAITVQSGAGNVSSAAIRADQVFAVSAQAIATSTLNGSVKLQVSNDPVDNSMGNTGKAPTNWNDVSGATVTINAASSFLVPKTEICANWYRWVWTNSSGTGNITVNGMSLGV